MYCLSYILSHIIDKRKEFSVPVREKSAWISMPSMVAIYGFSFWSVVRAGRQPGGFQVGRLPETIVALAIVQTILIVAVSL
jgi:hypothetical protein